MRRTISMVFLASVLAFFFVSSASAEQATSKELQVGTLFKKIQEYEKKEIVLRGTVVGTCLSGGKMWISEGKYQEGSPVILVRAKDDAFRFNRKAVGKIVILNGYPLADYVDYCVSDKDKNKDGSKSKTMHAPDLAGKDRDIKSLTFIAASVDYL